MMKSLIINDLKDTKNFAKKFAKILKGGEVILLGGDLGAGKTTFTKAVLKCLGVKDEVTSPTFTIMREYRGKKFNIYHFDMYRLTSGQEAKEFGLEDYIYSKNKNSIVFIEWPENVQDILVGNFIRVDISILDNNRRQFDVTRAGEDL